jgi:hypothetical protein
MKFGTERSTSLPKLSILQSLKSDTSGNFKDGYLGKLSDGGQNPCG